MKKKVRMGKAWSRKDLAIFEKCLLELCAAGDIDGALFLLRCAYERTMMTAEERGKIADSVRRKIDAMVERFDESFGSEIYGGVP